MHRDADLHPRTRTEQAAIRHANVVHTLPDLVQGIEAAAGTTAIMMAYEADDVSG